MTDAPRGIPDARQTAANLHNELGDHLTLAQESRLIAERLAEFQRETILGLAAELRRIMDNGGDMCDWETAEWLEQKARKIR